MQEKSYKLFKNATVEEIVEVLDVELQTRNESPFWTQRVVPFSRAIISVLVPLRDEKMLFNPEGMAVDELTPELFLKWSDFVSLKTLAFTIQKSNEAGELLRTKLDSSICHRYKAIDLIFLGEYLSQNSVDMEKESLDFPISSYNLHQGVSNVIKSLL
ncbi:MAG: hypothetical protein J7L21_04400 [Sulfurimonas sp.]|nr:hypothetical protein [Sulfurimonas sp.]